MIDLTLAHVSVSDLDAAETWYAQVFEREPDARPMEGLIEWRFATDHGLQVFVDREAAGRSTVVIGLADFDAAVSRLDGLGIDHAGVQPGGGGRLTILADPDGNRVVLLDPQAAHGSPGDGGSASENEALGGVVHATMRFSRIVTAPAARVWRALADVQERVQWSVPEGEDIEYDASEFVAGGVDQYRCGPPGALDNRVVAQYLRIDAPRGYVVTNRLTRDGVDLAVDTSTWSLDDHDGATTVGVVVQVASLVGAELLDGYRKGHELTLDRLADHVAAGE